MFGQSRSPFICNIIFDDHDQRRTVLAPTSAQVDRSIRTEKVNDPLLLYFPGDNVHGAVVISCVDGNKPVAVSSIDVELVGSVSIEVPRRETFEFFNRRLPLLATPTILGHSTAPAKAAAAAIAALPGAPTSLSLDLRFAFDNIDALWESYHGALGRVTYRVRVTITPPKGAPWVVENEIWVRTAVEPDHPLALIHSPLKMEVGIDDRLHIEFEFSRSKYALTDCIVGKVYFIVVDIPIRSMELAVKRRETSSVDASATPTSDVDIFNIEVMDSAAVAGECVPIRVFLGALPLTPTYLRVAGRLSVRYFIHLVLTDDAGKRVRRCAYVCAYHLCTCHVVYAVCECMCVLCWSRIPCLGTVPCVGARSCREISRDLACWCALVSQGCCCWAWAPTVAVCWR